MCIEHLLDPQWLGVTLSFGTVVVTEKVSPTNAGGCPTTR